MSMVQEQNRYQRAIEAISRRERVTTKKIGLWLKEQEGVGCSMREATAELKAWRMNNTQDTEMLADVAATALLALSVGMSQDARVMYSQNLRETIDWSKLANASGDAAEVASKHLGRLIATTGSKR